MHICLPIHNLVRTWLRFCLLEVCGVNHVVYLLTQVLLPTPVPTLGEAVDPITLTMYTAVEVSHLCSAVTVAIVRLEYTTADQEMKLV